MKEYLTNKTFSEVGEGQQERFQHNILKHYLELAAKNGYISWQIQNEIFSASNHVLLQTHFSQMKRAKYFSILADALQISAAFSKCLFIENCNFSEELLQFLPLITPTRKDLADAIHETLNTVAI